MCHVTRFDSLSHMAQGLLGYDQQFSHEEIAQWNEQLESQRQNLLVQMEQSSTDKKILANSLGEQPPKRKKANSDKDRRIFSIVQNYHSYEDDVLTYIDLLKSAMWNVYVIVILFYSGFDKIDWLHCDLYYL